MYRRRNNKRNNNRNRVPRSMVRRRKPIAQQAIRNAIKVANSIQKNREKKFQQNQIGYVNNIDTDGDISNALFFPAKGDSQNQRVGDRVILRHFRISIQFEYGFVEQDINPGGTAVNQVYPQSALFRLIVFIDKTNSISSVDEIIWPAVTNAAQVVSNSYDPDYAKNVTILKDHVYTCNPPASVNQAPFEFFTYTHVFNTGLEIAFDEGSTTVTSNALKYIVVSNVPAGATDDSKPDLLISCRSDFTEI
jgi:hypothetical protein